MPADGTRDGRRVPPLRARRTVALHRDARAACPHGVNPHCPAMPRFRCVLLLLAFAAGRMPGAAPEGEVIDQVWSGHPVSFALLVERGHQFIAYYDAGRRLTVLGRKLDQKTWERVQPPGALSAHGRDSNITGWDSHNYLRLALDRDGRVHLSGNMHVDPLVYYRSDAAFDVSSLARLDRMTGD